MKKLFCAIVAAVFCICCTPSEHVDYRQEMRDFVIRISTKAKTAHPDFVVIPQNGVELMAEDPSQESSWAMDYISAIDGCGQEDLFYGYPTTECVTPTDMTNGWMRYLQPFSTRGRVLAIDYCIQQQSVANSYQQNQAAGFLSYAAPSRSLDQIPESPIFMENTDDIRNLSSAKNFLYLINPQRYSSKEDFVQALANTNYDIVIVDLFFNDEMLTQHDVERIRHKANGSRRMAICYLSIGEAEDYRYYWQSTWKRHRPSWLDRVNRDWPGNYKVRYWDTRWQEIICGDGDSYLSRILNAGFDGVYLDIIDAFEYFEERNSRNE